MQDDGDARTVGRDNDVLVSIETKYPFYRVRGTANQLREEGWIPPDIKPPRGRDDVRWEAGGLRFSLRRVPPPGSRHLAGEFYSLRVEPRHWSVDECHLNWRLQALQAERDRQSPGGRRRAEQLWRGMEAARNDAGFQRFKSLMQCFGPAKRKARCAE